AIGTPWRRSGSRAPGRLASSDLVCGGLEERVFQAAFQLGEARHLDACRDQRLEDAGSGCIITLIGRVDRAVDDVHLPDRGQAFEESDRLFALAEQLDAQAPTGRQLTNDVIDPTRSTHAALVDDADHGAELGELRQDMAGNDD